VLAVPILTGSAAYGIAEAFGWRFGLDRRPREAPQFYAVIALSTIVGVALNGFAVNPISALVAAAIINGVIAPPLLFLVMHAANNRAVVGERINTFWPNLIGWFTAAVMGLAAIALLVSSLWSSGP
jgi:Mn2+/Fe2+ NRAMP family transporter